jgi:hypothetical protein
MMQESLALHTILRTNIDLSPGQRVAPKYTEVKSPALLQLFLCMSRAIY